MKISATIMFALLFVTGLTISSCTNYGKKEKSGHVEVYYKDKANKELARKLAGFMETVDKQAGNKPDRKSFQVLGGPNSYSVKMVTIKSRIKDVPEGTFEAMTAVLSESVFDGKPVDLELTNNKFKTFETVKYKKMNIDSLEKQ